MRLDWNYLDDLEYRNEGSSGLQGRVEILYETTSRPFSIN